MYDKYRMSGYEIHQVSCLALVCCSPEIYEEIPWSRDHHQDVNVMDPDFHP